MLPLLSVFAFITSGCCFPYRCGDATLLTCIPAIGRAGERTYSVWLPTVSLAKPSNIQFKVRGLKSSRYDYSLVMPLPRLSGEESWTSKGRIPSWGSAVVNIRFARTDGTIVSEKKYDLGASIRDCEWPEDGRWQLSLNEMKGIETLTDYDVEIQVIVPSSGKADGAKLQASGSSDVNTRVVQAQ